MPYARLVNAALIHYTSAEGQRKTIKLEADAPDQVTAMVVNELAALRGCGHKINDIQLTIGGERWWYKYNQRGVIQSLVKLHPPVEELSGTDLDPSEYPTLDDAG